MFHIDPLAARLAHATRVPAYGAYEGTGASERERQTGAFKVQKTNNSMWYNEVLIDDARATIDEGNDRGCTRAKAERDRRACL